MKSSIFKIFAISFLISTAYAEDENKNSIYVKVGQAATDLNINIDSASTYTQKTGDDGGLITIGFQIAESLSLEASLLESIEATLTPTQRITAGSFHGKTLVINRNTTITAETDNTFMVGAAYNAKLSDNFNLLARAGATLWDVDYSVDGAVNYGSAYYDNYSTILSNNGLDPYYGIGLELLLKENLGLDFNYFETEIDDESLTSTAVSAVIKF